MRIILSSSSGVPMYEQIKNSVRSAVHSGDLAVGEMLPSLRLLAADLRVSVMTVTRAYNDLAAERVVANEHGRGFVVLAIDPDTARSALTARVRDAVEETIAAGRAARMTREELHARLDEEWRDE